AIVARGGKAALTRYRLLRPLGKAASLVECRLATGRTHQIRVHMSAIGYPVVGDLTYGRMTAARIGVLGEKAQAALRGFRRQALHAYLLGFQHPGTKQPMRWQIDFPRDIKMLIESLEIA